MEYYFQGRKDLFEGLVIAEKEKDWTEWPVLKISFGLNSYEDNARLKARLNAIASEYEKLYGIERQGDDPAERLADVIRTAYEKTGKQVVILIDEYDKPILDALYTDYEEQNRQELRSFYSPLKDCDKYIRFLVHHGNHQGEPREHLQRPEPAERHQPCKGLLSPLRSLTGGA